jgi:hypothetical protein
MTARHFFAAAAAALGLAVAPHAWSQQQTEDEIVVTGTRAQELAQAFAGAVAVAPAAEDQYARWNFRMCPSVAGMTAEAAQTLIDHIALRANAVGVGVEPPGCRPNLVIIYAPDSDRLAREIVDTRRDLLGFYSTDDVTTTGREQLAAFANTPRPVRWWHVSRTVTADGQVLSDTRTRVGRGTNDAMAAATGQGGAAMIGNGFGGAEAVRAQATRFRRATRQDLSFALLIVDARRVAGLPPQAVADYLAMATLVQLNPDADMSAFPTILNLFADQAAGRPARSGMTDWDEAYLQGLYRATREAANSRQQRSEIARRIVQEIASE